MKFFYCFLSVLICHTLSSSQFNSYKIHNDLGSKESPQKVCIILDNDIDLSSAKMRNLKSERAQYVYNGLYQKANTSQSQLIGLLNDRKTSFRSYYLVNMVCAEIDNDLIKEISTLNSVVSIIPDGKLSIQKVDRTSTTERAGIEWGITKIRATDVWSMGYNGQGVVIGGQDTGYEWGHDALKSKYRGWNGLSADHDYNWHDAIHTVEGTNPCGVDSPEPCDDHNHGTHTMGTMVGDDGAGNQIGVAPGAQWIACRNMDKGDGTLSTYVECFEWFLAPYPVGGSAAQGDPSKAPHVINNSWACPLSEGCDASNYHILEQAMENLRNSGVVIVVSNGNEGSGCETTFNPAAFYQNSFSVGATTSSDAVSGFSSRGPVTIDGSNRLKPNVVAPGSGVRSSIRNNSYATFNGTSMAGPHVAGTVALMISANPNLAGKVEQIERILEETAVYINSTQTCGSLSPTDIPNNVIGYGRIDALAAVERALNEFYVPNIKVDQFGYIPSASKYAILSNPQTGYNAGGSYSPPSTIYVKDAYTHLPVFSGSPSTWNSGATDPLSGDKVWWFDFTSFTTSGSYYVSDNQGNRSENFEIEKKVYKPVLDQAFKTFYHQRCGIAKSTSHVPSQYADGACHLQDQNCRFISEPGNASLYKDMSGGWHDAGDYNKYVNFAYAPLSDLLTAFELNPEAWNDDMDLPESGNGIPDLLDEIKIETDWLLKMQDTDGGVHSLVGVLNFATSSPPSTDAAIRYYGPKTTSASFSTAAVFAFAARQFKKVNSSMASSYAILLESKAVSAYNWAVANAGITYYNQSDGLAAGEQEISVYDRDMRRLSAAIHLYALTNNITYKTYVETNYSNAHLVQWNYAYPFEMQVQNNLLFFSSLPGVTQVVADAIINGYKISIENDAENIPSISSSTDAYRAYLKSADIVWGSNSIKCQKGNMYQLFRHYDLNVAFDNLTRIAIDDFIHYIHGVNPTGISYLTNMEEYGADGSCNTMYHSWYEDGNAMWDDARSSLYGPPSGFLTGGPNPTWSLDNCCSSTCSGNPDCTILTPPSGQPPLKSYLDWNTGWPQNSWELTENSISYQAAYLLLLSSRVNSSEPIPPGSGAVVIENGDLEIGSMGNGLVLKSADQSLYRIMVENDGSINTVNTMALPLGTSVLNNSSIYVPDHINGLIIQSPNGSFWRIKVNKSGAFYAESVGTLPTVKTSQSSGDLQIFNDNQGIILKDQDGHCFMMEVDNGGNLFAQAISCPD